MTRRRASRAAAFRSAGASAYARSGGHKRAHGAPRAACAARAGDSARTGRTRAAEYAIDRARRPRGDRLHPAPERVFAVRLHHQVQVIALDRVVADAEFAALARAPEARLERTDEARGCAERECRVGREASRGTDNHAAGPVSARGEPAAAPMMAFVPLRDDGHHDFGTRAPSVAVVCASHLIIAMLV